ncbi:MAG TPA: CAP domain-containing protein [Symbiobacteriaceae bacterium]
MKLFKRISLIAACAVLLGTLGAAAPASAATYYYYWTYPSARYVYRYVVQVMPTYQAPKTPTPTTPTTPTTPSNNQSTNTAGLTAEEQQMLNLINGERAKAGLAPLKADPTLTMLARMKSQDMINRNYFSHQSPTYGSPFDMMKRYGVSYRTAGENIAGNHSVQAAHAALMNSPGHRANILNSQYTHVGIGIIKGGPYGMMFTQMFVGR